MLFAAVAVAVAVVAVVAIVAVVAVVVAGTGIKKVCICDQNVHVRGSKEQITKSIVRQTAGEGVRCYLSCACVRRYSMKRVCTNRLTVAPTHTHTLKKAMAHTPYAQALALPVPSTMWRLVHLQWKKGCQVLSATATY